ncbi:sucrase ferredoxin (plasmid) [Deinococcus taeanensis]|uniref:sucrase ferredoxin n=1 Tax=Deinococcus taeanensis TaxID=2737050 RepID=UPI001CDBCDA3|nr:sucrase ferredoxin [Deinococcus taeanensis]UBV44998.1 sucrase ferredoxin [Deinococcus taeanensis]
MTAAPPALSLCADLSRAAGEDPIGTAPHWAEVTVLELDIPVWAQLRQVDAWTPAQQALFAALREKVEASGAGFGLLMSAPAERGAPLRVRHYVRAGGGYRRRDYQSGLPQSEWARGLHDTLLEPARLSAWQVAPGPADGADLHVCTHGTVDAACGRYGVPVHQALSASGVRSWRTGHFGGHRFAATAVDLPSGLLWAHLTPDLAVQVARREVSLAEVAGHLRGYAGLPPLAQVLDRHLLVQHGWDWLSAERRAQVHGQEVTLQVRWQGREQVYHAPVFPAPPLHLPGSSHKPDQSVVAQYQLGNVTRL